MARPAGFEPATGGLEGRCSIQLSYGRAPRRVSLPPNAEVGRQDRDRLGAIDARAVVDVHRREPDLAPAGREQVLAVRCAVHPQLKGVGRVLRAERPETKIVVCEPADAPMLASGVEQERNADGSPAKGHPSWKPHPLQGWSPDFIPKLTGDAVAAGYVNRVITVAAPDAMHWSRQLAQKEGILVGISAGATFAATVKLCADVEKGSTVLCMLPDTGERYLSTPLFADIAAEMNEEELAISRS